MPNAVAYLVLALWPAVCVALFRTMRIERALVWGLLGGYLLLPPLAEFNLPLVPAMDKTSIPNLSVLVIILFVLRKRIDFWPGNRVAKVLVAAYLLCSIPTVLTNGDAVIFEVLGNADPIVFFVDSLPGLGLRDIGSVLIGQMLTLVPFVLARQFMSSEDGLRELLLALMVGALIYTLPALVEIRLSPQMNVWVYGFFQHSFEQMMRDGGFRPLVFLPHALWLAFFFVTALLATLALGRVSATRARWKYMVTAAYIFGVLVLCKSLASFAYAVVLAPLVLLAPHKWVIRLALVFALIAVVYPMLRSSHLVPLDAILQQAGEVSAEREQSLGYRFENEEYLLGRAAEKPLFGWGGWGRSLIHHAETGQIISVPDGRWIIIFGTFGWLGYIAEFGLLALPLFLLGLRSRRVASTQLSPLIAPVAMILGITLMDMLINATLTPLTWLTAGAVLGYAERLSRAKGGNRRSRHMLQTRPIMGQSRLPNRERTVL